jgi:N utilization substance protein B
MSVATARHRARELAMQGLYERQLFGRPDDEIAASLLADPPDARELSPQHDDAKANERPDVAYFAELWRGVTREYDALLAIVAPDLDRRIEALAPIERGLLAIGAWELEHRPDVPYRVVIDEAVELAKVYGGTDGHKFVNGVLDKVAARLRAPEIRASGRR